MKKFFIVVCFFALNIFPGKQPLKNVTPPSPAVTKTYHELLDIADRMANIYEANPQDPALVEMTVTTLKNLITAIDIFLQQNPTTLYAIKILELRETILSVLEG